MRTNKPRRSRLPVAAAGLATTLVLAACSPGTGGTSGDGSPSLSGGGAALGVVTLATHDSWTVPKATVEAFEEQSGYQLKVLSLGDAGELTNKLVLTKDNPIADATYGLDNTFATRAVDAGVLSDFEAPDQASSAARYDLEQPGLTPVDWGDVCVNIDDTWFATHKLTPPASLEDLADPAYQDLFVTSGAATSSPGFAFLLATIGKYGEDGWEAYWKRLMANGARIVSGWEDAYTVDFTAGGGDGDRPIVLSYSSSPPFTIPKGAAKPTTSALLDTCFRQVEYAGVLAGAKNVKGAEALVSFLVSPDFQSILPENMYVYPVDSGVALPPLWAKWAPASKDPIEVPAADIAKHRDEWIRAWSDVTSG